MRVSTAIMTALILVWVTLVGVSITAQNSGTTTTTATTTAPNSADAKKIKNPVKSAPESIAAGEKLFAKNCGFCHGTDAKGEGKLAPKDTHPPNLIDAEWKHGPSDGEIFTVIQNGVGPKFDMKGYKSKMTDTDIWNVVNYLRSLATKSAT